MTPLPKEKISFKSPEVAKKQNEICVDKRMKQTHSFKLFTWRYILNTYVLELTVISDLRCMLKHTKRQVHNFKLYICFKCLSRQCVFCFFPKHLSENRSDFKTPMSTYLVPW